MVSDGIENLGKGGEDYLLHERIFVFLLQFQRLEG